MPIYTGGSLSQNTRNTDNSMYILKQNIRPGHAFC
jgi:hypothetical protein